MCDMTHSYVWHDSFTCVTWLIHTRDPTHSHVWHDSCICVTWIIHMYDMTHSYVWHDSFTCVTWLIHTRDPTHSRPHRATRKGNNISSKRRSTMMMTGMTDIHRGSLPGQVTPNTKCVSRTLSLHNDDWDDGQSQGQSAGAGNPQHKVCFTNSIIAYVLHGLYCHELKSISTYVYH